MIDDSKHADDAAAAPPEKKATFDAEAAIEAAARPYMDIISRKLVRDTRLSFRALGVGVRLLSNAPGFRMTSEDLARDRPEGRDAIRKCLVELEAAGYLRRERRQLENGQWVTDVTMSDKLPAKPTPEIPASAASVRPTPENPASAPMTHPAPENPASVPAPARPTPENPASVPARARPTPENPASAPVTNPAPENPASVPAWARPTPENPSSACSAPPTPENPSSACSAPPTPENPAVGGSGAQSSNSSTRKITTTTTVEATLAWPPALVEEERVVVSRLIEEFDPFTQQQLLDELGGALRSPNPPRRMASWMAALQRRHREGKFVPDLGLSVAKERARRSVEAAAQLERKATPYRTVDPRQAAERVARARMEAGLAAGGR